MILFISRSEQATKNLARSLLKKVKNGIFCLYGDLGAGKTVFCKGLAEALGIPEKKIKSPTYVLIRPYITSKRHFYHCDFYRIREPDDVLASELEEIFPQKNAIVAIEWPERIENFLPKKRINLYFEYIDPTTRNITFE